MAEDWDDAGGEDDFMIHAVTADDYGVPSNLMGTHHEDFFALLGRIVALSASLEKPRTDHLPVARRSRAERVHKRPGREAA